MDFIKDAVSGSGSKQNNQSGNKTDNSQMDYVDKAWEAGSTKAGYNFDRNTDEKITDAARGAFEKITGKDVPDKVSN